MRSRFHLLYILALVLVAASASAHVVELEGVINRYVGVTRVDSCGPNIDVRFVHPGGDGTGAVLMGECDTPREDTQMVWLVGP